MSTNGFEPLTSGLLTSRLYQLRHADFITKLPAKTNI